MKTDGQSGHLRKTQTAGVKKHESFAPSRGCTGWKHTEQENQRQTSRLRFIWKWLLACACLSCSVVTLYSKLLSRSCGPLSGGDKQFYYHSPGATCYSATATARMFHCCSPGASMS